MTTLFQNFFKKKQLNRVTKDFPEMPSIDGLEISTVSAGLYNTNRDDVSLFYFPGARYFQEFTLSLQQDLFVLIGMLKRIKKISELY
jgi:hypothetical protein